MATGEELRKNVSTRMREGGKGDQWMQEKLVLKKFILEEIAGDKKIDQWNDDDSLLQRGLIDSVNILQILAFIEDRFKIKLTDEELIPENFESINSLSSLVSQKLLNGSTKCEVASEGA